MSRKPRTEMTDRAAARSGSPPNRSAFFSRARIWSSFTPAIAQSLAVAALSYASAMLYLLAVTAEQVNAGAAVAQTVLVFAGLGFAWKQISDGLKARAEQAQDAEAARRDQERAYVAIYFDVRDDRRTVPDLHIRNFGQTAAYDVKFTFDPPLRSSFDDTMPINEVGMIRDGIPTLPPGLSMTTVFDAYHERPDDWENAYKATVTYKDRSGETHTEEFVLDLAPYIGSHYVDRKGLHDVHERLKELVREVSHMRSGFGSPLPVLVEDRATYVERRERAHEEHRRRAEERRHAREQSLAEQAARSEAQPGDESEPEAPPA